MRAMSVSTLNRTRCRSAMTDPSDRGLVPVDTSPPISLWQIFTQYRGRILLTYALYNLENLTRIALPWTLGKAIDGLLVSCYSGISLYAAVHLSHLLIGSARQMFDTRTYGLISADLATRLVVEQRQRGVDVSRVAGRSGLSRLLVEFFERYLPVLIRSIYSVVGALVLLRQYNGFVVGLCIGLALPSWFLATVYHRRTRLINARLHDELEEEVQVIDEHQEPIVRAHYLRIAKWQVKLSDWEEIHFTAMELFVLLLMVTSLWHSCLEISDAGRMVAVFRYVQMFVMGLDPIPALIQQAARLQDIIGRLRQPLA